MPSRMTSDPLATSAIETNGWSALDPCVHCGFCLPACPTYLATGDENDSPRGRIVLMRGLASGELPASDPAIRYHLDRCLGCRGCEPACPSGVGYGRGLEAARTLLNRGRRPTGLALFSYPWLFRTVFAAARLFRATGIPALLAGRSRLGFPMGMLAASAPEPGGPRQRNAPKPTGTPRGTVALLRGCVSGSLFEHVHAATRRTLAVNGYHVIEPSGQGCCGAPHAHAGDQTTAGTLMRRNIAALGAADWIVVNAAGCGAALKDAGHLLGTPEAEAFGRRVRDVTELLAEAGPRPGAAIPLEVGYDPPCHLQHAQGVHQEVLSVLGAIPGLSVRMLPGADQCCGSAGIFNLEHPDLAGAILESKLDAIRSADPPVAVMVTGNPGCLMQIGAGIRTHNLPITLAHPVELLDRSYAAAGYYRQDSP